MQLKINKEGQTEENAEAESEASQNQNFARILATVEEDEKMLDEQLFKLKKREKMISQLQSNITKESYRKCEKQAEQLKGSNTKDNDVYNKEKSIKTRIQMYKSYKNLKNGKIRLWRKSSEDTSEIESERSESKKMISEGSVSKHSVHSTASAKKAKKNIKKKDFLDSKSKSFISRDHYSEEYDSDYVKSSRSTRNMVNIDNK